MENASSVSILVLSGLNESRADKYVIFAVALQGCFTTVLVNSAVIAVVSLEKELHQPMYILLCNLCMNGLYGAVTFYPKFLLDLHLDFQAFSFRACLLQTFAIFSYAFCEFTNLTAMSFDRYVAICKPLRYHSTVTPATLRKLLALVWTLPCCSAAASVLLTARLAPCEARATTTPYCRFASEACLGDPPKLLLNAVLTCLYLSMGFFVLYTYAHILAACRKSRRSKSKCMQTCLPHVISFLNYVAVTLLDGFSSVMDGADIPQWLKGFVSVAFLVTPPVLNPIIYGISLTPIRTRVGKML